MEAREDPLGETVELLLVPTGCAQFDSAQLSVLRQCGGNEGLEVRWEACTLQ